MLFEPLSCKRGHAFERAGLFEQMCRTCNKYQ